MNNEQIVTKAYQRTFGDLDVTAVDEFFSKDFVQRNPTIADGPEGVKALVQMLSSRGVPKQKIEFKHVFSEGDVVILHSQRIAENPSSVTGRHLARLVLR